MPMKYVAFILFLWIAAGFMGYALEESFPSTGGTEESDLAVVSSFPGVKMPISGGTEVTLPSPSENFFSKLWRMATFDFKFLHGGWEILRMIVFAPLAGMVVYALVMTFVNILQKSF